LDAILSIVNIDNNNTNTGSWDARTYDKISTNVQMQWGRKLIEKRRWIGDEIVMDAGAGSGNLTKILADKVPNGQIYAVDIDLNMIEQAKINLSNYNNVQVIHSSMDDVKLPTKVDIIFSNAAFHWVLDQQKILSYFWQLLKPNGELLIECGGYGNLEKILSITFKIVQSDQFKGYFANWKKSWYFPKPDDTERLLKQIGFRDIQVYLSEQTMIYPDRESFMLFVRTVIMKPFIDHLRDTKKDQFFKAFVSQMEQRQQSKTGWILDYVRLNIFARK
jgi:trans-aconitate methyltransferase